VVEDNPGADLAADLVEEQVEGQVVNRLNDCRYPQPKIHLSRRKHPAVVRRRGALLMKIETDGYLVK